LTLFSGETEISAHGAVGYAENIEILKHTITTGTETMTPDILERVWARHVLVFTAAHISVKWVAPLFCIQDIPALYPDWETGSSE
jgi:hypothetical protein